MQAKTIIDYKPLYEDLQLKYDMVVHELEQLKKMIFGSRHERFVPSNNNPSQLALAIQAEQIAQCNITSVKKIEYTKVKTEVAKKEHPGRHKLPEHLERKEIIIAPLENTEGLKKIGEEVTEELDYEPGKLFVNKYVRPKYAKPGNEGVIIAPMIERPLPKAIAGAGLLTQIVIDKYVDHLPLYRQMERFKREGINIPYSTITDWVSGTVNLISALYDTLKKKILQSDYLHADETPVKVLDKDKQGETCLSGRQAHRGYFWVYHNSIERLVLFDYQQGRGREGPVAVLKNFNGHIQTDGYSVYDFFKEEKNLPARQAGLPAGQAGITVLHCMAHARRKFYDALTNDKPRAEYALEQFGLLYNIERKAKQQSLTAEQLLQLRKTESMPVLKNLGEWMRSEYVKGLPQSPIGKALGYSIERWNELMIYATDGKLNIDNNPVENSIRPVAIGRKNYLFAGSHEAAQRSAMLYSLLGTCKLHGINPFIWLRDVLQRIPAHPINKVEELLPQNLPAGRQGWKPLA
jgi:transposase